MYVSRKIFSLLHDQVCAKFEEDTAKKYRMRDYEKKGYKYYGFGNNGKLNSRDVSLKRYMLENEEVSTFLNGKHLNGKYLYDRKKEYDRNSTTSIRLTTIYEVIFFKYLGFENIYYFLDSLLTLRTL